MPETGSGEIKMPRNPEQSPAGPEKPVEPTFEQRVLALIDPPIRSKVRVADEQLVSLVRGALGEKGQDVKEVSRFLESGDELIIEGKAPEVEWKKVKPLLEQKRASLEVVQPDAVRKTTRTKLDRRLKGLITPRKTKSKPEVVDQRLVDLARSALEPEATQASKLAEILTKGRELYQDGMVKPEEWRKLAPVLEQRQAELRATVQPEPSEPRPARPTARRQMSSPSVGGISPEAQRIAEDLDRVQAEIRDLGGRGELNSEDVKKFAELLKASQGIYGGAAMPGLESQRPTIPSVERIGPEEYRAEFHKRLTELIEQNVDQSFDANWRLVYPLETAISSLRPEHGQADTFEYGGQEHSYSDLRRELAIKLSAFRACHNHAYLHTRVGGVDSLIDASHLLRLDSIEYLLGQKDIARGFAKFEELGRQYREADETMNNKVKDS